MLSKRIKRFCGKLLKNVKKIILFLLAEDSYRITSNRKKYKIHVIWANLGMTPFGAIAKSRVKNSKPKLFEQSFFTYSSQGLRITSSIFIR